MEEKQEGKIKGYLKPPFFFGCGAGILAAGFAAVLGFYFMLWHPLKIFQSELPDLLAKNLKAPDFSEITPNPKDADYTLKFKDLDGKAMGMDSFKGKAVFLNFWATWCGPCVAEMPGIQELYDKTKNQNIVFALLSNESASKVKDFVAKKKFSFPIYIYKGALPDLYKTSGIPATFLISPKGKLVLQHVGSAAWNDPKSMDYLRRLSGSPQ